MDLAESGLDEPPKPNPGTPDGTVCDVADTCHELGHPTLSLGAMLPVMAQSDDDGFKARQFLYPLNPKSAPGYYFEDRRGVKYPTSYEGFMKSEYSRVSEWSLVTGFNLVRDGDLIWVYFSKPDGAIRAVGRVTGSPRWNEAFGNFGRHAIRIEWDRELTDRLVKRPIPYESFMQKVQAAVLRPNNETRAKLDQWLERNQTRASKDRDEAIGFTRREVEARLGQAEFRRSLMQAYGDRCSISGCDIDVVLQAAHIRAVRDGGTHSLDNGLLLRADLHNLFDDGLITINDDYTVSVDASIRKSDYGAIHRRRLRLPSETSSRPKVAAIRRHRKLHTG